jgi:tRNA (mo5U34)-methyltransferase
MTEGNVGQSSSLTHKEWLRSEIENEGYWFHRIELAPDLITPGWSDPRKEKLPHFGLPEDMTGMRVLDIGCAEGFFSFEAERRGAREVVAIDSFPDSIRRFNICRSALSSKVTPYLSSVYDVNPRAFGTFDLVLFYGVLYHLRNPILALERILGVCTGTMLLQTASYEVPGATDIPLAKFHPFGSQSGPPENPMWDPTVFWLPNAECAKAMVTHAGFQHIEAISTNPTVSIVVRARSPIQASGRAPDQTKAPWC